MYKIVTTMYFVLTNLLLQKSVVWSENQPPGDIVALVADDYDSLENGPPFTYKISSVASDNIKEKFSVVGGNMLRANVYFDREEQKYYDVPIAITDSGTPPQTGISYIRVIIGDVNDNPAKDGFSEIFIYSYQVVTVYETFKYFIAVLYL